MLLKPPNSGTTSTPSPLAGQSSPLYKSGPAKKWVATLIKVALFLVATEGLFMAYEMVDALIQLHRFGLLQ